MQFLLKNKLSIGIGIAAVVAVLSYVVFFGKEEGALLESTQTNGLGSPVSRELLIVLGDLRMVTLDSSLFADPSFKGLVDFGVAIPLQPVGRRNPFAPLSGAAPKTVPAASGQ